MAVPKNTSLSFQFLNSLKSQSAFKAFDGLFFNLLWFFKFIMMIMVILFLGWLFLADKREPYYQYSKAEDGKDRKVQDEDEDGKFGSAREDLDACSYCGKLCTITRRTCSRCKTTLYCSWACQVTHWRFWHEYECNEMETEPQYERPVHGASQLLIKQLENGSSYSSDEDDEQITDAREAQHVEANEEQLKKQLKFNLLTGSSEEAIEEPHEIAEQVRTLKEELAKIKNENMSLKSERDNWETLARSAKEKLDSFIKESEHQMLILKHKKELISDSEKQARALVNSLSEKLRCLQIAEDKRVAEMKRQEEFILMLKNEYSKAVREVQEEKENVRKLRKERDRATDFAMKLAEETGQKLLTALDAVAAIESRIASPSPSPEVSRRNSLDRNPIFLNEQACAICLTNDKDMAFGCGHMTCRDCGSRMSKCPICRQKIKSRVRLFHS
ncbi:nuclear-pore anchor-like isoform X1 [Prosopis cineraria]|uniref:nuclear-pore anchor-like isoform X1 n=3 Tax=Prosopis cineraria TaxID=364024 RepID=UPI0024102F5F|nr:nuclear-pore anchor-like isoform X1 [Prosopis cineraria]